MICLLRTLFLLNISCTYSVRLCATFWEVASTCCPLDKLLQGSRTIAHPAPRVDSEILQLLKAINGNLEMIAIRQPPELQKGWEEARKAADHLGSGSLPVKIRNSSCLIRLCIRLLRIEFAFLLSRSIRARGFRPRDRCDL